MERQRTLEPRPAESDRRRRVRRASTALVVAAVLAAAVHYGFKAAEHRSAIVRWRPQLEALVHGVDVYRKTAYPNPPLLGILLYPLTLLAPLPAALTWFSLKVAMAVAAVRWSLRLACAAHETVPAAVVWAVVILAARPLLGDLEHGNVNIVVFFVVTAGLWAFRHQHDRAAGLAIGLATAFKVTPALFIPYFAYKREWRVVLWSCLGLGLFLLAAPALVLGPSKNGELLVSWTKVMVKPYVVDGVVETVQTNQSLPALFLRLFTDSPGLQLEGLGKTMLNWASLEPAVARGILKTIMLGLVGWLCWICRRPCGDRRDFRWACEFSLVLIAMLFLSERSWKHHYVTMVLPYAALATQIAREPDARAMRRYLTGSLVLSFLLMASTSTQVGGVLADGVGPKYAQVYGMFLLSAFSAGAALSAVLIRSRAHAAASRTTGSWWSSARVSAGSACG